MYCLNFSAGCVLLLDVRKSLCGGGLAYLYHSLEVEGDEKGNRCLGLYLGHPVTEGPPGWGLDAWLMTLLCKKLL
jgi:hypothetical protein